MQMSWVGERPTALHVAVQLLRVPENNVWRTVSGCRGDRTMSIAIRPQRSRWLSPPPGY